MTQTQPSSSHRLTQHVKLLHKVALISKGQVLILRRSAQEKSRPGKWDLAGGNSEWPADLDKPCLNLHQNDISREIVEETGIEIPADYFTDQQLVFFATHFSPETQIYSINCGWRVTGITDSQRQQVKISSEHSESTWISLTELDQYDFGGPDRDYETKIIRRCLAVRGQA